MPRWNWPSRPEGSGGTFAPAVRMDGSDLEGIDAGVGMAASADRLFGPQVGRPRRDSGVFDSSKIVGAIISATDCCAISAATGIGPGARHGAPGYFFANYPDYRPETSDLRGFPALYEIVVKGYDQIGGVANANCAAVYLRRDLVDAWHRVEIPLRGSAAASVDGFVTENCGDWWTPEKAADAAPDLVLDQPEPVPSCGSRVAGRSNPRPRHNSG